ncbi:hypothetical protein BDP81DRAFT_437193 [Colletotrichum phormii]|uniref:BZIP domain-containing protein n=1 Tax=Colletotrichum phormii TaxID=359342 RepID=A0AAI9ZI44_9PEZI|nr:uncharacterized protein BDP81DRAFT_437193 [Colletotrichum phormii]KAK1624673.1 hypothetical protein BDP81DRAFT_437193 [Colletotrichum phormii]
MLPDLFSCNFRSLQVRVVSCHRRIPTNKAPQMRRERNREAQKVFRKRKQAAEEIQAHRLQHLETTVAKMSSAVVELVDWMLDIEALKQEIGVLTRIQEMVAHVLALADDAVALEDELPKRRKKKLRETKLASVPSPSPENDNSPGMQVKDAGVEDTAHVASSPQANIPAPEPPTPTPDDQILSHLTSLACRPTSLPPTLGTFHCGSTTSLSPDLFSFRLTHTCFTLGYLVLSKSLESPLPHGEEPRIFSSTLKYRERDDLITKMRWLVGPGQHELQQAAELPMGGRWYGDEFSLEDLSPGNFDLFEKTALADARQTWFLGVAGVERQLIALGARVVDKETLGLTLSGPLKLASGKKRSLASESWSFVDYFPQTLQRRSKKAFTVQLNNTLLIANLSRCAVCLMKGPGFPRDKLKRAIEDSVVMVNNS